MSQIVELLRGAGGTLPRGACLAWEPWLVTLHAGAAGLIAVSFFMITAAIAVFLRRRGDLERTARHVAWLFMALFIGAGTGRALEVLTIWLPLYGVQGLVTAAIAAVAGAGAVLAWPQIPRLLRLPSPRDLQRANAALAEANASLETTIAWRTHELEQVRQRYEMALSRSNITVFTQDRDFRFTWIHNPRLGLTPEQIVGRTTEEVLPGPAAAETEALARRALESGLTVAETIAVPTEGNGRIYLDLTVSPTTDQRGAVDGVLCTAVDVTEKRLFEVRLAAMAGQVAGAYRRFELALENSPITVFEQDAELRYTMVHNPPPGTLPRDFLGRSDHELFSEADQGRLVPPKQRVFEEGTRQRLEVEITVGGRARYYDLTLEPRIDADGAVAGVVGTAVDLTERRRSERQMRLVMRELTHRSKNLLAVIQAMARKTASQSESIDEFVVDFSARLRAIAAAHDLLVSRSWSGADLGDLLRASLSQTLDPSAPQIGLSGPTLLLTPETAQTLALAFHELATNAAKYGSLSVDPGRLTVRWERVDGAVRILWTEAGGPEVQPPARRGFGRVLLERLVAATLGGEVRLSFHPEGVECEIVFPADRLIDD